VTLVLVDVTVISANTLSLQEIDQLIGIKLLTSGLQEIIGFSPISTGENARFNPLTDVHE